MTNIYEVQYFNHRLSLQTVDEGEPLSLDHLQ